MTSPCVVLAAAPPPQQVTITHLQLITQQPEKETEHACHAMSGGQLVTRGMTTLHQGKPAARQAAGLATIKPTRYAKIAAAQY